MSPAAASVSLPDVSVSRAEIASVRGRLRTYQARYAPFFGRRELRGHARTYLQGLLSDEPRKSVERMVLRRRGPTPMPCWPSTARTSPRTGASRWGWRGRTAASWASRPTARPRWPATPMSGRRVRRRAGPPRARSSRPFLLREGAKGPQAVLCAVRRVVARRGLCPGPDVWLLLRRNPATDELKCYLSHGPADLTPDRLVWLAGLRWPIEQCFRDGKQLFGLGDYEGRSWQGWHRHATLVMLAHFFVVRETLRLKKTPRPDRAPDLSAGGCGPAPHRLPDRPRPGHRGLPPGPQRSRPPHPCPVPTEVLRVPVPAI